MAQLTLYVPDDVAKRLKLEARKAKKSVSAYVVELAAGQGRAKAWPTWFRGLAGSCRGSLVAPDDLRAKVGTRVRAGSFIEHRGA